MFVWLDIETTGLNPREDEILEIAWSVQRSPWTRPEPQSRVFRFKGGITEDFVFDMHTKNGLLADCRKSAFSLGSKVSYSCCGYQEVMEDFKGEDRSYTLCGASVHFDLSFIQFHMPFLAEKFSHRLLDTSAIGMFAKSLGMPKLPKAEVHRAAADVIESWEKLVATRDWFASLPTLLCEPLFPSESASQ